MLHPARFGPDQIDIGWQRSFNCFQVLYAQNVLVSKKDLREYWLNGRVVADDCNITQIATVRVFEPHNLLLPPWGSTCNNTFLIAEASGQHGLVHVATQDTVPGRSGRLLGMIPDRPRCAHLAVQKAFFGDPKQGPKNGMPSNCFWLRRAPNQARKTGPKMSPKTLPTFRFFGENNLSFTLSDRASRSPPSCVRTRPIEAFHLRRHL